MTESTITPTTSNGSSSSNINSSKSRSHHKLSTKNVLNSANFAKELLVKANFETAIPNVPVNPKFLKFEFEPFRFIKYRHSAVEKNFTFNYLSDSNLNIPIELIDQDTYATTKGARLHPDDEVLLRDEVSVAGAKKSKEISNHNKNYKWLRRPQYMSVEHAKYGHSQGHTSSVSGSPGPDASQFEDKAFILDEIERAFSVINNKDIAEFRHPRKKNVHAVEAIPVLPNLETYGSKYSQVSFSIDPTPLKNGVKQECCDKISRGVLYACRDGNDVFFSYLIPSDEAMENRKAKDKESEQGKEEVEKYEFVRDYDFRVVKAEKASSFIFTSKDSAILYNDVGQRISVNVRRSTKPGLKSVYNPPSHANVRKRELNRIALRKIKRKKMEIASDVELSDMSEEEVEEEIKHVEKQSFEPKGGDEYDMDDSFANDMDVVVEDNEKVAVADSGSGAEGKDNDDKKKEETQGNNNSDDDLFGDSD